MPLLLVAGRRDFVKVSNLATQHLCNKIENKSDTHIHIDTIACDNRTPYEHEHGHKHKIRNCT